MPKDTSPALPEKSSRKLSPTPVTFSSSGVGMGGEERVEERHIPERDVAHGHVVVTGDMVREGGLVAFITSQGVLNAEQGRPVREWLMNRCEPVSAIRLPNNLFTEHAGTEVGSDLVILQKKAATGELSERQRDFIESRKLSNGIRINNLFQSFDRVIHTEAKVGKDPYGKPAMEFTHAEGVDGIDREMRRMLSEDFNRHFNESYCLEHAPEQTPGTPERELSRPRQAERQRAERHEPRLAGEIVKEIIADARNLHEKIVVQRPCALPPHGVGMGGEERVEERHVPERDVAHGHVVVTGVFGFDALESLYPHPFFGVQVLQDQPRGGVFLEAGDLRSA